MLRKLPLCLALLTPVAAHAEGVSVETAVGFESRYVFRGVQYAETSFQPAITLGYNGFYVGAWLNLPVGDDGGISAALGGEELDLFAGYSGSFTDIVSYDIGVTYYTFPEAMSGFGDLYEEDGDGMGSNTVEAYFGVSADVPLSPSIYVYHDFNFDTTTVEGSLSYSFPLADKTSLDIGGAVGYVADDAPDDDYLYGSVTADIVYAVTDKASISAGGRFGGSDLPGGSIIDESLGFAFQSSGFWWGVSFSSTF